MQPRLGALVVSVSVRQASAGRDGRAVASGRDHRFDTAPFDRGMTSNRVEELSAETMNEPYDAAPEPVPQETERQGPAQDFALFAELEFERRRNSQKDFDAETFRQAVELVLRRLGA